MSRLFKHEYNILKDIIFLIDTKLLEVRLVGGTSTTGRVEVQYHGVWRPVCDHQWDDQDAQVVCNMMGFRLGFVT